MERDGSVLWERNGSLVLLARLCGVFKQGQAGWDATPFWVRVRGAEFAPAGGVLEPQAIDGIIEKEGRVGIEIEQWSNHHAPLLESAPPLLKGLLRSTTKGKMKCTAWYTQATIDPRVVRLGDPRHIDPLHKGQGATIATVKKHVIHPPPFRHQHLLVDDDWKAELALVKLSCGRQVKRAKTEMVEGHRGFGVG